MATKKELRKEVRLRKKQHTDNELKELSHDVVQKLLELSCIKESNTIMLYCSLPDEVYTMDLIHRMKEEGKSIVLPVVVSDTEMELRTYESDSDLRTGSFDILEPCGKLFTEYERIDVAVIPGMGFDRNGNRLGRGKGYYDRFLERAGSVYKIGICFPFQVFDEIPTDENDISMDKVLFQEDNTGSLSE